MHKLKKWIGAWALIAPLWLDGGGITLYEVGSSDVGLASAGWSARADEPSTAFTNPAGMSRFTCREVECGAQPLYAHVKFNPNKHTTTHGSKGHASPWIPAGGAFYVQPINERWAFGASVLGYFGAKLNFNPHWVGRYYLTEIILEGFSCVPAISCKLTDRLSIGGGINAMYGVFKQKAAINNSIDHLKDGSLKLYDDTVSWGAILGVLYEWDARTRIGIQYISEVKLQFHCTPHFYHLGPTLKKALSATGVLNSRIFLNVNIPQTLICSVYHDLTPALAIMGNVGWQEWSNFQKATIALGSSSAASLTTIPKYQNTWHAAFGAKYQVRDGIALSLGFAYDSSAVSAQDRTLDFPVGKQLRYGAGIEWWYRHNLLLGLEYEFQHQGDLQINVNKGILTGKVAGKYQNVSAQFLNFNLQWLF